VRCGSRRRNMGITSHPEGRVHPATNPFPPGRLRHIELHAEPRTAVALLQWPQASTVAPFLRDSLADMVFVAFMSQ
jgi:hypothetical protein